MEQTNLYADIAQRTGGDIYVGIVGPVRTGKSTFIKKFMETLVIPNIESDYRRERATDELPQSAAGKTIMTTEPKFIPEEAVTIRMDGNAQMNVRMIDCVGYIIPSALGYFEEEAPRMVVTPWFEDPIPFNMAAEIGTQKVISEHATVGIVITTDGSITDLPREEYEEAEERTKMMWEVYKSFVEEDLAIPVVAGRKTESEKFAGAQDTYTIEALMHDGQALQSATSHFFGNSFPDAFDIKYADKNNELHSVYETSWGLSTRIIGAIIMVHGDDSGLVLPPRIAPVQVRVIPIAQHKEGVLDKANELLGALRAAGYRAKIDDSEKSPGWKFSEQEMLGIPARIEIGPKDIENGQVVVVRRDTREKIVVEIDEITTKLGEILETIQKDLYARAKAFLDDHISTAVTMDEMKDAVQNKKGFVKAMWCGEEACEDEIKAQAGGVTSRCIPMEEEHLSDVCVCCGKPAKHMVYWGRAY